MRGRWSLLSIVALVVICAGLAQTSQGHALLERRGSLQGAHRLRGTGVHRFWRAA